ncbi:hypothetical protein DUNSADRAFT_15039 [Dunaliella salina]|uniref:Riboflavin biosynthesis intermediates N-glycosidase n=1 Tax=Dunaliella salina TaxID=3046 RepID=A0ABQ7G664_DUNSA|nr:hypothetical protein DUNSADRAFT_15039 [Dunaliella salina]|eukprot:KAF5830101.1 hypothetical protein DUNSADRAFT_15039 [Dunaliella salina]
MTQRGARKAFQAKLRAKGVEVVEFDFLTPEAVADYCYDRGFLQCLWECGGVLAAPVISASVAHKLMAFVAPKIIGGARAPSPVGDLGFVEMTQALEVAEAEWQQVGRDLMLTGYFPSSGGLRALERALGTATSTSPRASTASGAPAAAAGHGVAAATVSRAAAGAAALGARSADSSSSSSSSGRRTSSGIDSSSTEVSRAVAEANATNAAVNAALSSSGGSSNRSSTASLEDAGLQQQQQERSIQGSPDSGASSSSGTSGSDSSSSSTLVGRGTKLPSQPSSSSLSSDSIAEGDGLHSSGVGGANSRGLSGAGAQEAPNPSVPAAICSRRGLPPGAAVLAASQVVWFYKAWDEWGALSNFSPHPIHLPLYYSPNETSPTSIAATDRQPRMWACAEHFYQAQKFSGSSDPEARAVVDAIAAAASPEEAARTGRLTERHHPHLLTPNWSTVKVNVMLEALTHTHTHTHTPRSMLLASGTAVLVEAAPHDFVWGGGHNGSGTNMLGRLLMRVLKTISTPIRDFHTKIRIYKVKSHAGIAGNECADAIAKRQAKQAQNCVADTEIPGAGPGGNPFTNIPG